MSSANDLAREDLAYIRALVEGPAVDPDFGIGYFLAGLFYGAQIVASGLQIAGWLPSTPAWSLTINLLPTAMLVVTLVAIHVFRRTGSKPSGVVGRTISALFATLGASNLVFLAVVAFASAQGGGRVAWLMYGCAVFVLQGAAWMVAWVLRRKPWLAAVGAGWFMTAIGMAAAISRLELYVLICGVGLTACMTAPGYAMMRQTAKAG